MFKIHKILSSHKLLSLLGLVIFFGIIAFLASRITLEEDISNLIPTGERQEVIRKVLDNTEFSDKIIISISSETTEPDPEALTAYAQQFLDSVELQLPQYINDIQGKVPEEGIREIYNFVYQNLPLFLNESDYKTIESKLERDSIRERMEVNYKNLISPTGLVTKEFLFKDPLALTGLGLKKLEELQVEDDFELYNNFLISKDLRHVLLFISPALPASETDQNLIFTKRLDEIFYGLNKEYDGVKGDYFGGVLYSIANATQIKSDIRTTIGIAGIILLLVLIYYYKKVYIPILVFIPSLLGGLTAIALIYLLKGSISAISLGIGSVLLGISIDYSLHILTHFKNNNDLRKLYSDVTLPVLMSSITTAVAFLCLLFLQSEALNDLGLFAAISVITASLFALILIPLFYKTPSGYEGKENFIDRFASIDLHKKRPLVLALVLVFIVGLFFFNGVNFNTNLSDLNYEPEEIRLKEQKVKEIAGRASKSIYVISYGNNVDEALGHNNELYRELGELKEEGMVSSFSSIGGVVLSTATQLERITQWKEFWTQKKISILENDLVELSSPYGFMPQSFQSFYTILQKDFEPIYLDDYRNTTTLYLNDFITSGNNFATVTTSLNIDPEHTEEMLSNFAGRENMVVIDRKELNEKFLGDLRQEFNRLIGYSLVAVFLILLLFYRSVELTILTLVPIGITWVITLGLLNIFNIEFNILNIIISTFIFGLGLDYSIFITNAFLSEYSTGIRVLKTYRTSIILSVITTLLGIGALFFAVHPALRSISLVSIIGVISAMLVAFIIQGFIFQNLFLNRKIKGEKPFSFKGWLNPSKYIGGDKLYHRSAVYDNYRYKKELPAMRKMFDLNRERYLKVSDFIESGDKIFEYPSGNGLLAVFLYYKFPEIEVSGFEADLEKLQISCNTLAASSPTISFSNSWPEDTGRYNTFIISGVPSPEMENRIRKMVSKTGKKVIVLDREYSYRWVIDLNFEIKYRQNDVVLLQKVE